MSFDFTEGPTSTQMTLEQIVDAVDKLGRERQFVGVVNRLNTKRLKQYGAFTPEPDDSSPAVASRRADRRIGWQRKYFTLTQTGLTERGWSLTCELWDDGPARRVVIKAHGESDRKEVDRFVTQILDKLWWERAEAPALNAPAGPSGSGN